MRGPCFGAMILGWVLANAVTGVLHAQSPPVPLPVEPPPELAEHVRQIREAERIRDVRQRCLAYPDLPGNAWPAGSARARCGLLQTTSPRLDHVESMLARSGGADDLQRRLADMLEVSTRDPERREDMHHFYMQFDEGARAGGVVREWIRQAPDSPFALAALGRHRAAQAWSARGGDFIQMTSRARIKQMGQLFAAAQIPLARALEREPRLTPACVTLAEIGRQSSDALQATALAHCLKQDPLSYYVVEEWMTAAMPKWGGSMRAMAEVDAYVRERGTAYPLLYALLAEAAGYTVGKTYVDSLEDYLAGAKAAPAGDMLGRAGLAYGKRNRDGDAWQAVVYLSQAIRFLPSASKYREARGRRLAGLDQVEWSADDLAAVVADDPDNLFVSLDAGAMAMRADRNVEARRYLERAMELPEQRAEAFEQLCYVHGKRGPTYDAEKAVACITELAQQHPDDARYWMWYFATLDNAGHPEAAAVGRRFLQISDPSSSDHKAVKEHLERGLESR